jgi:hypothetical protein
MADPGEPDRRPRDQHERQRCGDRCDGGAGTARDREPHNERPQKQLQRDPRADGRAGGHNGVAPVPERGDRKQEERPHRSEVEGTLCRPKEQRERVAPPVAQAEPPEREHDRRNREDDPQEGRGAGAERVERRGDEREQRRIRIRLVRAERVRRDAMHDLGAGA